MLLLNIDHIPGKEIEALGIVKGSIVQTKHFGKDFMAGMKTLVWNGPLGAFEVAPFDAGTTAVAREAADLTKAGKLLSVAGGGDTVAALAKAGADEDFSYISTAGGAFLEWLEGKDLPGVAVLRAG